MRATEIGIKSPREFTPAPYTAKITYDGRRLFNNKKGRTKSLWRAERFSQYQQEAKKTGFRVGPGSYNIDHLAIGRFRALKTPLYKTLHGECSEKKNSYYMVGQTMVSFQRRRSETHDLRGSLGKSLFERPSSNKRIFNRRRTVEAYVRVSSPKVYSPGGRKRNSIRSTSRNK